MKLSMKYAIISDIHGNIHAFNAVLEDAKAQGVDMYLLLGDYTNLYPYGNDVINAIRNLENTAVVRGNGEDYLINLRGSNKELTDEQFKPVYWGFCTLSQQNLEYIANLPEVATISDGNTQIQLTHSMSLFFPSPPIKLFHSTEIFKIMMNTPFTHEEYLPRAQCSLLSCPDRVAEIEAMPKGIYLFGHNHLQFHMEYDGRVFVNPGSCGDPLNWDTRASYTILDMSESGFEVEERRVAYDLTQVICGIQTSGFFKYSPMWSKVMELQLLNGRDYSMFFVLHLVETGKKMGTTEYPVSHEVWEAAIKTWDSKNLL